MIIDIILHLAHIAVTYNILIEPLEASKDVGLMRGQKKSLEPVIVFFVVLPCMSS